MKNKYEQEYLIELATRIALNFRARSAAAQELSNWLENHDLGFDWDPDFDSFKQKGVPADIWSQLRGLMTELDRTKYVPKPDALARNIDVLAAHVALSSDERKIFELAVRATRNGPVRSLCTGLVDDARLPVEDAITSLTGSA